MRQNIQQINGTSMIISGCIRETDLINVLLEIEVSFKKAIYVSMRKCISIITCSPEKYSNEKYERRNIPRFIA